MVLSFELFKDIRNSGTVLKRRDTSGCIPNLKSWSDFPWGQRVEPLAFFLTSSLWQVTEGVGLTPSNSLPIVATLLHSNSVIYAYFT